MKRSLLLAVLSLAAVSLTLASGAGAGIRDEHGSRGDHGRIGLPHAVFVQTNEPTGNRIVAYARAGDGTLVPAGSYPTGGNGAVQDGAVLDTLASQGSLTYDPAHHLLFAVNAGSNTLSTFLVVGTRLFHVQVLPSGGAFPTSVAVHGNLVYVLNAGGPGTVQGFRILGFLLFPIRDGSRSLGLANADTPNFLASPGQVGFSPDGRQLIVTTKASTSSIEVFPVGRDGRLGTTPVVNPSATPVPFSFTFDRAGRLVVAEAGASTVTTYALGPDGTLSSPQSQADGQAALCWIASAGGFFYASNTGSNTISAYTIDAAGAPNLLGVVGQTETGAIDAAASSDGDFLYVESGGSGTVDEFRVGADGSLSKLGAADGLPAGIEGIAAT